jgi:hypothetical protein
MELRFSVINSLQTEPSRGQLVGTTANLLHHYQLSTSRNDGR